MQIYKKTGKILLVVFLGVRVVVVVSSVCWCRGTRETSRLRHYWFPALTRSAQPQTWQCTQHFQFRSFFVSSLLPAFLFYIYIYLNFVFLKLFYEVIRLSSTVIVLMATVFFFFKVFVTNYNLTDNFTCMLFKCLHVIFTCSTKFTT